MPDLTDPRGDVLLPRAIPTFRTGHRSFYPAVLAHRRYPANDSIVTGYAWPEDGAHYGDLFCVALASQAMARAIEAALLIAEGDSPYDHFPEYAAEPRAIPKSHRPAARRP